MDELTAKILERIYIHCVTEGEHSVRTGILNMELGAAKPTLLLRLYSLQENGFVKQVLHKGTCSYQITDRGKKLSEGEAVQPLDKTTPADIYQLPIGVNPDLDGIVLSATFNSDEAASAANSKITAISPPKRITLNGSELKMMIETRELDRESEIMSYIGDNLPSIRRLNIEYLARRPTPEQL